MTLLSPGTAPSNDEELIRSFHDRIRALERANTTRVGAWTLITDPLTGALKAVKPGQAFDLGDDQQVISEVIDLSTLPVVSQDVERSMTDLQKLLAALRGIDISDPGAVIRFILARLDALITGDIDLGTKSRHPPYSLPYKLSLQAGLSQAQIILQRLLGFLKIDPNAANFDLLAQSKLFIDGVLLPAKKLAELINDRLPDIQAPPIVGRIVTAIGGGIDEVELFFSRLKVVPGFDKLLSATWNLTDMGIAFITGFVKPLGLLGTLVNGKQPNEQAAQIVSDIVANIQAAVNGANPVGGLASLWLSIMQLVNGIAGNAGQIAVVQSNQNAGNNGKVWSTQFDGAQNAPAFPEIITAGGGTGDWVLWGDGTTRVINMSMTPRRFIGVGTTPANTKYISSKVTITSPFEESSPELSSFFMVVMISEDRKSYVICEVGGLNGRNRAEIGTVINGDSYTRLGDTFATPDTQASQSWELRATDDYTYTLLMPNGGGTVIRTDAGHLVSPSNRRHGSGVKTGSNVYGGTLPPHFTSYAGGDFVPS